MKPSLLLFGFLFFAVSVFAQQPVSFQDNWMKPNGDVSAITQSGNTVYIGGGFTSLGYKIPNGACLNSSTAMPDINFVKPDYLVYVSVPDGAGGWYIGGYFSFVGGQARNNIARINADGTLNPWNPNANGGVAAITVRGSVVYVGGDFTNIGGQTRNHLAAISASTGNATAWNPNANDRVATIAVNNNLVYVGGQFTTVGSFITQFVAAIDSATGVPISWNPQANSDVNSIAISGNKIYLGGLFDSIGGQQRKRIASLDLFSANVTTWNPIANSPVLCIAVDSGILYVGGDFTMIGGQNRNYLAAFDESTGNLTTWNPNPNSVVECISVSGGIVYVGGYFDSIGGQLRHNIAAVNKTTGIVTSWNPNPDGSVIQAIGVNGNNVYIGGNFSSVYNISRNNLAAIDISTGAATAWNPYADSSVLTIAIINSTVYVGGSFDSIGGLQRKHLAALDSTTGLATTWNPNANAYVKCSAINGNTIYVGGGFSTIGNQTRKNLAAIDATTGIATTWNPNNVNAWISSLAISGNTIYVGGQFDTLGGQLRKNIAAINAITGLITTWNPNANHFVYCLTVKGNVVYVGGHFTTIGGQSRKKIAAIDANTGLATAWNPHADDDVQCMSLNGSYLYIGGDFLYIGNQNRYKLAAIDTATGFATPWDPHVDDDMEWVNSIAVNGTSVYVGGFFTSMGGNDTRQYFIPLYDSFLYDLPAITSFTPNNGCSGTTITINGTNFTGVTSVKVAGTPVTSFTINSSTSITAVVGNGMSGNITLTNAFGTVSSTGIFTYNIPLPTISSTGSTTICDGDSVVFNTNTGTGFNYQWQHNYINISGATNSNYAATTAGVYNVILSASGCSSYSNGINVTVNPVPTASIAAGGPTTVCWPYALPLGTSWSSGLSYQWCNNGYPISGATSYQYNAGYSGNYSVIVTNSNNCSDTSLTIVVTVNPTPVVNLTAGGATTICAGDTVVLSTQAVTGYVYEWYQNNIYINNNNIPFYYATTSGSYQVKAILGNCSQTSNYIVITVNPLPSVTITQTVDTLNSSGSFNSYQWYYNGTAIAGATNAHYNATQNGNYHLIVTDGNGCNGQSNTILFTTGIEDIQGKLFSVSPNPFKETITITGIDGKGTIVISDVMGKVVKSLSCKDATLATLSDHTSMLSLTIDLKGCAVGVYFIKYQNDKETETIKVIKQ